jgi:hypothetical protein
MDLSVGIEGATGKANNPSQRDSTPLDALCSSNAQNFSN